MNDFHMELSEADDVREMSDRLRRLDVKDENEEFPSVERLMKKLDDYFVGFEELDQEEI